ncbi:MAG: metallopeptidase family protein [Candidatus Kryptoniota bacterium]
MDIRQFEELVEKSFDELPSEFKEKMENVHIVVQDFPDEEDLRSAQLGRSNLLLGLYSGVPLTKRGIGYGMYPVVPDRIKLYKSNIEAVCKTDKEVVDKIKQVLIHEIAHYFGMSDSEIRKAGY